jgi:hypothetical protein
MTDPTALPDPGTDPGVTVSTGDPGRLYAAATTHETMANTFQAHSTAVSGTAQALSGGWSGDSAFAYQALSGEVAAHFANVSTTSHNAASSLRTFAGTLEHSQEEGQRALAQAKRWLAEKRTWTTQYNDATKRVTQAQTDIIGAKADLAAATAMDAKGAALATAASARLKTAQQALIQAQGDQGKARTELDHASTELTRAQRLGDAAWHDAQVAAVRATGELAPLQLPAPPMPGQVSGSLFSSPPGSPLAPPGATDAAGAGVGLTTFLGEYLSENKILALNKALTNTRGKALDAYELAVERAELQGWTPESTAEATRLAQSAAAARVAGKGLEDDASLLRYVKIGSRVFPIFYIGADTALNATVGHQSLPTAAEHAGLSFGGFVAGTAACSELGPGAVVCGVAGSEAGEHPGTIVKEANKVANSSWMPWGAAERLVSGMRSIVP